MRKSMFVFCPLLLASIFLYIDKETSENAIADNYLQSSNLIAIGCAPGTEDFYPDAKGKYITIMPGWGNYSYAISTKSDSAQLYFNQGLTMYYSYHSREAVASFKEAAKFDSTNAMVYWGQALAMGPTYNFG